MNERTNEERPDKIEFEKNSYKIVDIQDVRLKDEKWKNFIIKEKLYSGDTWHITSYTLYTIILRTGYMRHTDYKYHDEY